MSSVKVVKIKLNKRDGLELQPEERFKKRLRRFTESHVDSKSHPCAVGGELTLTVDTDDHSIYQNSLRICSLLFIY